LILFFSSNRVTITVVEFRALETSGIPPLPRQLFEPHADAWWNYAIDFPTLDRSLPKVDCHFVRKREYQPLLFDTGHGADIDLVQLRPRRCAFPDSFAAQPPPSACRHSPRCHGGNSTCTGYIPSTESGYTSEPEFGLYS
jgi:hypothetical protein